MSRIKFLVTGFVHSLIRAWLGSCMAGFVHESIGTFPAEQLLLIYAHC